MTMTNWAVVAAAASVRVSELQSARATSALENVELPLLYAVCATVGVAPRQLSNPWGLGNHAPPAPTAIGRPTAARRHCRALVNNRASSWPRTDGNLDSKAGAEVMGCSRS